MFRLPRWTGVASWHWIANDENCGICRMAFDGCCPDCRMPGDDCPLGNVPSLYYYQVLYSLSVTKNVANGCVLIILACICKLS